MLFGRDATAEFGRAAAVRAGFRISFPPEWLRSKWTRFSDLGCCCDVDPDPDPGCWWCGSSVSDAAAVVDFGLGSTDCSKALNRALVKSSSDTCLLTWKSC